MLIRKIFKYEMSHRVYGAYTRRCSHNIHGHSYKLELLFTGNNPDVAQMVLDFGHVKKYFYPFVDSFDHAHMIWHIPEMTEELNYIKLNNERWIVAPFSSTAEMQAKMFYTFSCKAIKQLQDMGVVDKTVRAEGAIVHETDTGYADYRKTDEEHCMFPVVKLNEIEFSDKCLNTWSEEFYSFYSNILYNERVLGT